MLAGVPAEWVAVPENAAIADGFTAAPFEVMLRFGQWDEILEQQQPQPFFPIAVALWRHTRGVAYAAKGQVKEARAELDAFRQAAAKTPKEAAFGQNKASDLYAVADPMLEGEILAREGKLDDAIASLRKAAAKEDTLRYDEPPDWIVPVRHALGAFLLKANRPAEAEAAYREDLQKWPNNGWSLYGLAESLAAQGKTGESEIVRAQFRAAWKHADVPIHASCLCAVKGE
jgi:tetratricopeptide (TPR) repeat protein